MPPMPWGTSAAISPGDSKSARGAPQELLGLHRGLFLSSAIPRRPLPGGNPPRKPGRIPQQGHLSPGNGSGKTNKKECQNL